MRDGGVWWEKCKKLIDSALNKLSLAYYEYTSVKMSKWLLNLALYMWNKIKKTIKDYVEKLKEIKDFQRVPLFEIVGDVAKEHIVKENFEKDENKEKIFILADR